jgi:hypothetical protein
MNSVVVDISPDVTVRIIERAVRKNAAIRLEFSEVLGIDEQVGRLTCARRDSLIVTLDVVRPEATWRSACCDGSFMLDHAEYMFTSSILDFSTNGPSGALEILRPELLQTWQRRRFMRATVADSARVVLSAPGDFDHPWFAGDILNVSEDGLACRVERVDADRRAIGDVLGVKFPLGSDDRPHTLNAVVKSKTPGGTEGTIILGIQFDAGAEESEAKSRLAAALRMYV